MARVCSWCGLPDRDWLASLEALGTAVKPATELICVARKPLIGSVAENVKRYETGALNIGASRIEGAPTLRTAHKPGVMHFAGANHRPHHDGPEEHRTTGSVFGRWPSNVLFSHHPDCRLMGQEPAASDGHYPRARGAGGLGTSGHAGQEGLEERSTSGELVDVWSCVPDCPVAELDRQSGVRASGGYPPEGVQRTQHATYGTPNATGKQRFTRSAGGASRFFLTLPGEDTRPAFMFTAKASPAERRLPDGTRNMHPTVKPLALMHWLIELVTPPGGTVLDPFAGSGTTLVAAHQAGFAAVGIEREAAYVEIIRARLSVLQPRLALGRPGDTR